ncbi:hypothetical protein EJD97_007236 [Solanum chilense]|uniref:Cystatin domain-containing protein n=1 Tax=Solanum chilense TaxID=4083 RepID=A0A6N2BWV7_SOLCI|nr:hypothetical protein EJD97_007236 [Solanum chilense]
MTTQKVHEGNPVPVVPFNDADMNRVPPPSCPPPENMFSSIAEESESPAQKKLRIEEDEGSVVSDTSSEDSMVFSDEVNDTSSPIRPTYSQYDSDEDFCPYYPQKMDKAVWEKYYQQVKESEGFDITDYPGQCAMTTVYPMPFYLNDPKNVDMMTDYAGKALRQYNDEKGTNYEVNDILKVNGGGCRDFIFYITFSVKTCDDKDDIFQAKVVKDLRYRLQFPLVRPKPKKASNMQ